ncbi:hypothetical protein LGW76_03790 [Streptococcus mutans]|nr:hypothetical protein [Streptococcus mutans]
MALTDENMQDLQAVTKESSVTLKEGAPLEAGSQQYEVVATMDSVTQGISVAPIVNGKADYSQTAVVVAGTQPPGDKNGNGLGNEIGSTVRAFIQGEYGYSMQGKDVEELYQKTEANLKEHKGGEITNMSGHSQAGPAVAKVAAKHNVNHVTNFSDWGAGMAYAYGYITEKDKKYLNKHAHIYSDSKNETTKFAADGGNIPYGQVREVEGSDHSTQHARIKGNNVDVDYYVKRHQFCSGMTKEQVKEVAKYKAKHDGKKSKATDDYVKEYKKEYGDYAKKKTSKIKNKDSSKAKQTSVNSLDIKHKSGQKLDFQDLLQHYKGTKGSKRILLRKALLFAGLSAAIEDVGDLAKRVQELMDKSKEDIRQTVEETRSKAFDFAKELDAAEVESLLADIDFNRIWSEGVEAENFAQAKNFAAKVEELGNKVLSAGDAIEEADQGAAEKVVVFNEEVIKDFN